MRRNVVIYPTIFRFAFAWLVMNGLSLQQSTSLASLSSQVSATPPGPRFPSQLTSCQSPLQHLAIYHCGWKTDAFTTVVLASFKILQHDKEHEKKDIRETWIARSSNHSTPCPALISAIICCLDIYIYMNHFRQLSSAMRTTYIIQLLIVQNASAWAVWLQVKILHYQTIDYNHLDQSLVRWSLNQISQNTTSDSDGSDQSMLIVEERLHQKLGNIAIAL